MTENQDFKNSKKDADGNIVHVKKPYARKNTKRVCIKLTEEQHQFLIEQGKFIGTFGMSEVLRLLIDREMRKVARKMRKVAREMKEAKE